jgi:tetratricopeptide (TPR) repeat protein
MVTDRELVTGEQELPLPESVQGIVAARLDALPEVEKTLLQDAAVVGKVFWLGAASDIGGVDHHAAEETLHRLERKEFVRRERRPSVAGESEYAFGHVLVRDVAYSQIPRARRAEKHRLAGDWIERLGRPEDHAEMLAYHYSSALELTRAAGNDTAGLEGPARRALHEAGDRAYALGSYAAARKFYAATIEAWPAEEPQDAELLIRYGRVLNSAEVGVAGPVLGEARDAALAARDPGQAAEAETLLGEMYWLIGLRDEGFEHLRAAEALVANQPSSYAKAFVMASVSRFWMLAGGHDHAIRVGRDALAMAEELELGELEAHALNNIGSSRLGSGDRGGFDDLERSIEIADAINSVESARAFGNMGSSLLELYGQLERAFAMLDEARRRAERFGLDDWLMWLRGMSLWQPYFAGRWDEAFSGLDALIESFREHPFWIETSCRVLRGRMRLGRGDRAGARDDAERALGLSQAVNDPQLVWPALAFGARAVVDLDPERAGGLLDQLLSGWEAHGRQASTECYWTPDASAVLRQTGRESRFLEGAAQSEGLFPWRRAAAAYVSGDFRAAAEIYREIGAGPEEAFARLRAAGQLVQEGRRAEADAELEPALAFWRSAGATAYIREGEALLAATA